MYTLIVIFYASCAAMALLIFLKRREMKTGKPSLVSVLGADIDHIFQAVFSAVRRALSYINRHTFIALGHWVAFHILVHIRKVYIEIKSRFMAHPTGKKLIDAVRGRGEVHRHGASFYLRHISADSKNK